LKDLTNLALDTARARGATYADVRVIDHREQAINVKNGVVESSGEVEDRGFGVRVITEGAWGFVSSAVFSKGEVERVAALAVEIARASARANASARRDPVDIGPPVTSTGAYRTPVEIDPFSVPVEDKVALLLEADAAMRRAMRGVTGVTTAKSVLVCLRERKTFANTEGAFVEQEIVETGGGLTAVAVGDGEVQQRSYPNSFGRDQHTAGWECIQQANLPGNAERIAGEAVALLTAAPCPSTVTTVILGSTQLALQIHESCGHPTELDRVFGAEAAYAGTSFLTPEKLGALRYGSPVVNLTADATLPGGLGTFGWDDEGVPAQRIELVKEGLFVGYLSSRETAAQLAKLRELDPADARSGGAMRASSWNRIPIVRMTNISIEPGEWAFDDLIADTDAGIYMEVNRSWSIDDRRLNFQFGTELGYEIKHGRLGRMLKNCTYTGITPQFWNSCDAVCDRDHWQVWGTPNCGKGQPSQIAHTGHGAAPARFRNVQVGVYFLN
jgi:TldD protein